MDNNNELTARQQECLDLILEAYQEGWLPTVRGLCAAMSIGSPNGVACHLRVLRSRGWLAEGNKKAGIKLGPRALEMFWE